MISPGGSDGPSWIVTMPIESTLIICSGWIGSVISSGAPTTTGVNPLTSPSSRCQLTIDCSSSPVPRGIRYTLLAVITTNREGLIA